MFRTIVVLGLVALCAFVAGWFTIDRSENETTIRFNRDEIKADTSKAIAKGRDFLNRQLENQSQEQPVEQPAEFQFPSPESYVPQQATRVVPPWEQVQPTYSNENSQQF